MTCADAGPRIDAFVDGELPPSTSVEVARHVGQCTRCDGAVQRLLTVREALAAESERVVAALDLSGVWPRVDGEVTRSQGQAAWRERVDARRRVPLGAVWASLGAIAAGGVMFVRSAGGPNPISIATRDLAPIAATRVAAKRLPNHVLIDRLAGKDIAVRREPKSGTTMIWVNHEVESTGW